MLFFFAVNCSFDFALCDDGGPPFCVAFQSHRDGGSHFRVPKWGAPSLTIDRRLLRTTGSLPKPTSLCWTNRRGMELDPRNDSESSVSKKIIRYIPLRHHKDIKQWAMPIVVQSLRGILQCPSYAHERWGSRASSRQSKEDAHDGDLCWEPRKMAKPLANYLEATGRFSRTEDDAH